MIQPWVLPLAKAAISRPTKTTPSVAFNIVDLNIVSVYLYSLHMALQWWWTIGIPGLHRCDWHCPLAWYPQCNIMVVNKKEALQKGEPNQILHDFAQTVMLRKSSTGREWKPELQSLKPRFTKQWESVFASIRRNMKFFEDIKHLMIEYEI